MAHSFREAVEAKDHSAMTDLLADDIEFHSPVAFTPFIGRESVSGVLGAVLETFEDFEYFDEMHEDDTTTLFFKASVGGKKVQGIDYLRCDDSGRITELTVMLRPLSGLIAMAEAMAPKVTEFAKGAPPK